MLQASVDLLVLVWAVLAVVARVRADEDRAADMAALGRMARGDREALGELYDRHARAVYSLALRIVSDPADAEDVVQEVFSQAWSQASRFDAGRGAVGAWLLMLTRSRAIDRLRVRRARPEVSGDEVSLGAATSLEPPADLQVLTSEQVGRLRVALDRLQPLQRIALELAYYEGLTHAEIAARLEQPLGTVKTRIRQALITLRESMAEVA